MVFGTTFSIAQSRFSVAPTYWFTNGIYKYQVRLLSDPVAGISDYSGYSNSASFGLMTRYHFQTKWSISVGMLYDRSVSHLRAPQYNTVTLYSEYIQLPIFVNYRLTTNRLSPYFSVGAFFEKNIPNAKDPFKTNVLLGVGIDYRITSKLSLLVQPTASYLLYKPADSDLIKYDKFNSYKAGVQAQAIWHF